MALVARISKGAAREFEARGISPAECNRRIGLIGKTSRRSLLAQLLERPISDLGIANLICERSVILERTSALPGFARVARLISDSPKSSLSEPEPAWFQLLVDYLIVTSAGEEEKKQNQDGLIPDILERDEDSKAYRNNWIKLI